MQFVFVTDFCWFLINFLCFFLLLLLYYLNIFNNYEYLLKNLT